MCPHSMPATSANTTDRSDALYRIGAVAHMLGVSTKTVDRWEAKGYLKPLYTRGGHRRYPAAQVEAMLTQRRERAS